MMDALVIPKYCDKIVARTVDKCDGPDMRKPFLKQWPVFGLEHISDFQHDIMEYCEDYAVGSDWVRDFILGGLLRFEKNLF